MELGGDGYALVPTPLEEPERAGRLAVNEVKRPSRMELSETVCRGAEPCWVPHRQPLASRGGVDKVPQRARELGAPLPLGVARGDRLDLVPCGDQSSNQVDGVILHPPDAVDVPGYRDDADPHREQVLRRPELDSKHGVLFECLSS